MMSVPAPIIPTREHSLLWEELTTLADAAKPETYGPYVLEDDDEYDSFEEVSE